jgi:alkylation response protein AidB-like acyl-CoA dehydrogenase
MVPQTEEQRLLVETVRRMAEQEIAPGAAERDERQAMPLEIHSLFFENGLLKLRIPESFGGVPAPVYTCCLVIEEIARVDGSASLLLVNHLAGLSPFLEASTDEQKARVLPRIVENGDIIGFALTEPGAGSDAASIKTRAVLQGDFYVLNGTKCFITNGGLARMYTLFATIDPALKKRGITAFVVEGTTPGFRVGKKENKMGMRASPTTELILEDAKVPRANLLGKEGEGWPVLLAGLSETRLLVAALSLGLAEGATRSAARYAGERIQFGRPVAEFQGVQFMLADMVIGIETARALIYRTATMLDNGEPGVRAYASMAKCYSSDMAMKVTTDAVQILGGYGYMKEYPVERMMRDAKAVQIFEGTNQIQRLIIAKDLLARVSA